MFENYDIFGKIDISRRDFMKLIGAGSLLVGLGVSGIPNVLKNIKEVSAQVATTTNTTNVTGAKCEHRLAITWIFVRFV